MAGSEYKVFTDRYDRVIKADDLDEVIGIGDLLAWSRTERRYEETAAEWIAAAGLAAIPVVDEIRQSWSRGESSDHVASLLVDHSGSLRGQKAILACVLVDVLADFLERLGIRYEILGFTTSSWKGGKSRRRWNYFLRPNNPGRLCDLLHIVYRMAHDTAPGAPRSIRNILRPSLLKENVDGEAIQWAVRRLEDCKEQHKTIIVISDGAPVDDSTLLANSEEYLENHLVEVVKQLQGQPDFRIGGIGIDYDVDRYYARSAVLRSLGDLDGHLMQFVGDLIAK